MCVTGVKRWPGNMQRNNLEVCPVDMTQVVTYEVVASYMTITKDGDNDKYLSCGTYIGICSSIVYLFTISNLSPPTEF